MSTVPQTRKILSEIVWECFAGLEGRLDVREDVIEGPWLYVTIRYRVLNIVIFLRLMREWGGTPSSLSLITYPLFICFLLSESIYIFPFSTHYNFILSRYLKNRFCFKHFQHLFWFAFRQNLKAWDICATYGKDSIDERTFERGFLGSDISSRT